MYCRYCVFEGVFSRHRVLIQVKEIAQLQGERDLQFLRSVTSRSGLSHLSCPGVFPLPNVKLTWGKFDLFADKMTAEVNPYSECYEVTIHKVLEHQELPSETKFGCEIEIPGTDYFVR